MTISWNWKQNWKQKAPAENLSHFATKVTNRSIQIFLTHIMHNWQTLTLNQNCLHVKCHFFYFSFNKYILSACIDSNLSNIRFKIHEKVHKLWILLPMKIAYICITVIATTQPTKQNKTTWLVWYYNR